MKHILSIDGGGIRGIIPAALLQAIEEQLRPISQIFDLISGTSTGGILAAGLSVKVPAKTLSDLYVSGGADIFQARFGGSVFNSKYSPSVLETKLKTVLGRFNLSDVTSPELLIPSYCVQLPQELDLDNDGIKEGAASWFFKSWEAREDKNKDFPLWEVARATSAAPTYFPTAGISNGYWMVDGGVFANNPAMCALVAAWKLWPGEDIRLLSLGTGSKITALDGKKSQSWGVLDWAGHIFPIFMDGAADAVSYQCKELLGGNYLRCETALAGVSEAFDDASVENILSLKTLAAAFTKRHLSSALGFLK